jgi:hypothetical protein
MNRVGGVESTHHEVNHNIDTLSASFHNFMGNFSYQNCQQPLNDDE